MTDIDIETLRSAVGRSSISADQLTPQLIERFRATLAPQLAGVDESVAPLGLHWCLAPLAVNLDALGADGHAAIDPVVPVMPNFPHRLWAGGELEWIAPLQAGDVVTRRTRLDDISIKTGRSGTLCLVSLDNEYASQRGLAIRERQTLVYRASTGLAAPLLPDIRPEPRADLGWTLHTDPVLLFRYSALTFNAHRIHYDLDYATRVEGHPGLLVHGPLQATVLMNLVATLAGATPRHLRYRGLRPLVAGGTMQAQAVRQADGSIECWTCGADGVRCMEGIATW